MSKQQERILKLKKAFMKQYELYVEDEITLSDLKKWLNKQQQYWA